MTIGARNNLQWMNNDIYDNASRSGGWVLELGHRYHDTKRWNTKDIVPDTGYPHLVPYIQYAFRVITSPYLCICAD